jgi:5-methylcytosine-specific restriction protein A
LLDKSGYCPAHADQPKQRRRDYETYRRNRNPELKLSQDLRNTARWRKVRKQFLADHPLCADPRGDHARAGVTRDAKQVHHIKPLVTHPELAFTRSNLMAVCHRCHFKIEKETPRTREDGPGEPESFTPFG